MDIKATFKKLESENFETQIEGLDECVKVIEEITNRSLRLLSNAEDRLFIAERIYLANYSIDRNIIDTFNVSKDEDLNFYLAIILLLRNHKFVVKGLIKEIEEGDLSKALFAATKLASLNVEEAIEPILNRLRRLKKSQTDEVTQLLNSLKDLKAKIPSDLVNEFSDPDTPWQIRAALDG